MLGLAGIKGFARHGQINRQPNLPKHYRIAGSGMPTGQFAV
jgi:hypothetical protein